MSRRAVLWVAFVIVHVGVAALGFLLPNEPMGDVYRVYEPWSRAWLAGLDIQPVLSAGFPAGAALVGITESWVYPQLAIVPMLIAWLFSWLAGYEVGWAILVTLCDALAFALLVGRGRSTGRWVAAWFWLAFIAVLGPVGMYRLDGVTVPLAIAGSLWLVGRPWVGSALLAVAMWIKVWPAALIAAALVAVRRRLAVLGAAVAVSAAVVVWVLAMGGASHLFGFVLDQTDRGLQLEAPVSTVYVWQAVARIPGSQIYYEQDLLTFQVTGPLVDTVIAIMTPLLVLAVAAVAGVGVYKARGGASFAGLYPNLALALVLALIVFNKVGSPQYMTWIAAPIVVGLAIDRRRWWPPAILALVIAGFTLGVYPLAYFSLLLAWPFPATLLTIRNVLVVVLFVWVVVRLCRVPTHPRVRAPRHADALA
ncbi:glycosyltransferase 87 family protein [Microbacterium sp. BK668]|uniref:glycosyltransferase 87 family protein n=1 Tax=Microbacterium sp. BK668 TaxID=2512118 RepID=UPI0010607D19|nr:glycosyltransferase 87 family protein [Microbacterium sp. BK668]TDN88463.1 uncharacterized protein DUF2029 [Microbacterium sp. BK668]